MSLPKLWPDDHAISLVRRVRTLLIFTCLTSPLLAQENEIPVGSRVIMSFSAVLRVGDRVIDDQGREQTARGGGRRKFRIFRVDEVRGSWLWLCAEKDGVRGWARADEVIPLERAINHFSKQIVREPTNPSGYVYRGLIWSGRFEYDLAISDFGEALRLNPTDVMTLSNRGMMRAYKQDYERAIADLEEAGRLSPRDATISNNLGYVRWKQKDYGQSLEHFGRAVALDPGFAMPYGNRGLLWMEMGQFQKALVDCDAAVRLEPRNADHHYNRAVSLLCLGQAGASVGFEQTIEQRGWESHRSLYAAILGHFAAARAGKEAEAKAFVADAAAKGDPSAWPFPVVKFLKGEIDEPGLLAMAVDDDKKTEVRCFLGLDHAHKGRKDEAMAHFRWVKEHGTSTFTEYTIAYAELERMEKAEAGKP